MPTMRFPLLQTIDDPADLRRLPRAELKTLANELRALSSTASPKLAGT